MKQRHFQTVSPAHEHHSSLQATDPAATCHRCEGFLIQEYCFDLLDGTGENGFWALRCFQCGELFDPMILHHRQSKLPDVKKGKARFKSVMATSGV